MSEKACRRVVAERANRHCERCGIASLGLTMHHRKNRSQGGEWTPTNIVALCGDGTRGCHGWVTMHPRLAGVEGFHVQPWCDPAVVPILLHRAGSVLLNDAGDYLACS